MGAGLMAAASDVLIVVSGAGGDSDFVASALVLPSQVCNSCVQTFRALSVANVCVCVSMGRECSFQRACRCCTCCWLSHGEIQSGVGSG